MSASPEPILFEAVSTPHRSLRPRAYAVVVALAGGWALLGGLFFAVIGAWPILPFLGVEILGALALILLHHRWSGRAREVISLLPDRLRVRRVDGLGRREEASLDPYWTRVEWSEREGLALVQRRRRVPIGRFLSEEEQQDLAQALRGALRAYREPVFDNPQLGGSAAE
ncbi:DUF2244 domain-containing protein [Pseudoroseomonas cervicalis]|uniref:DUF2244 domain-containing protein n=1 Tax=Teichococcus cervicalis TaxID=204525 RepID=UPI000685A5CB|nr:DUF2244 domain-containing protein [Pseudoroseomonas cervicalis]